jgi:hypothetical protein
MTGSLSQPMPSALLGAEDASSGNTNGSSSAKPRSSALDAERFFLVRMTANTSIVVSLKGYLRRIGCMSSSRRTVFVCSIGSIKEHKKTGARSAWINLNRSIPVWRVSEDELKWSAIALATHIQDFEECMAHDTRSDSLLAKMAASQHWPRLIEGANEMLDLVYREMSRRAEKLAKTEHKG